LPDVSREMTMENLKTKVMESKIATGKMGRISAICLSLLAAVFSLTSPAFAVPETSSVRITDVTTSSFSVVWMTDVAAEPLVEVYSDSAMTIPLTDYVLITPMPASSQEIAQAAKNRGIMKVRVSGLSASTKYYARTVTRDPANTSNVGYSPLYEVVTASTVAPYYYLNGTAQDFSNDLIAFRVHIRPSDTEEKPGLGDLIVLEAEGSPYPLSAFVGEGITAPDGILDMNNLFSSNGWSRNVAGSEKIALRIYRGGGLFTLTHYRRVPLNGNMVYVVEPVKGFFADINLDGKVDEEDFATFKGQYRTSPDDASYNPDFNFVEDPEGKVDAREFSRFSTEYGRTNVE